MSATETALSVLIVLKDVENTLATYVQPKPDDVVAMVKGAPPSYTRVGELSGAVAKLQTSLTPVKELLEKIYEVEFIQTAGHTIGTVLHDASDILVKIADKFGALPTGGSAVQALSSILAALVKLPVSPTALTTASEFLAEMVELLNDVEAARAELYMIAQQLEALAQLFEVVVNVV